MWVIPCWRWTTVGATLVRDCRRVNAHGVTWSQARGIRGKYAAVDPIRRTAVYLFSLGSSIGEIDGETSPSLDATSLSPFKIFLPVGAVEAGF
jgi:hypothetical protein